jgi:glycosyltransferase involved in cell wall biosynthesis
VFAPSESVRELLRERGVTTPIEIVPTGVDLAAFEGGSGAGFRAAAGIPEDAFVVGHLGRLAPEKNLGFLAAAVAAYARSAPRAHFLVVGSGTSSEAIRAVFERDGLADRVHLVGPLVPPLLASAYRAMNLFVFASTTETQGMVVTEAMACGLPVIALDAPGIREVVRDRGNGRLLAEKSVRAFAGALAWCADLPAEARSGLAARALETARDLSLERTVSTALDHYARLRGRGFDGEQADIDLWEESVRLVGAQWDILVGVAGAVGALFRDDDEREASGASGRRPG